MQRPRTPRPSQTTPMPSQTTPRESEKRRLARAAGYVPVAQVHNMIERIVRIGAVSGDKAGQRAQTTTDMDALK